MPGVRGYRGKYEWVVNPTPVEHTSRYLALPLYTLFCLVSRLARAIMMEDGSMLSSSSHLALLSC